MNIITLGHNKHTGIQLPIRILDQDQTMNTPEYSCYKIVHIRKGASLSLINGVKTLLLSPSVMCLNESDSIKLQGQFDLRTIAFLPEVVNGNLSLSSIKEKDRSRLGISGTLDLFWIAPFISRGTNSPIILPLAPSADKSVTERTDLMSDELIGQEADFWPCRTRSYLIELLFLIGRIYNEGLSKPPQINQSDNLISDIMLYLNTHYDQKITLDRLAKMFFTNRTTMQQLFSRASGRTIGVYLRELRMSIARSLLSETKLPVSEISLKLGYPDPTNFIRIFQKLYGITPAHFRQQANSSIK